MPSTPAAAATPALITFTSGSTGTPKAALRTHGFLLAQQRVLAETLELTPGDIDLATLPIFVLANLAAGVTSITPNANLRRPGAIDPGPVLAQIRRFRPNRASGSPAFFERLADGARTANCSLDSFERIYTGGAPVFPGLLDRIAGVSAARTGDRGIRLHGGGPIAHVERSQIRAHGRSRRDDSRTRSPRRHRQPSVRWPFFRIAGATRCPPLTAGRPRQLSSG